VGEKRLTHLRRPLAHKHFGVTVRWLEERGLRSWRWEPTTYQRISRWGHTREGQTIVDKFTQFKSGAASLLRDQDVVPALAGAGIPDN
jgi:hypothetical protein